MLLVGTLHTNAWHIFQLRPPLRTKIGGVQYADNQFNFLNSDIPLGIFLILPITKILIQPAPSKRSNPNTSRSGSNVFFTKNFSNFLTINYLKKWRKVWHLFSGLGTYFQH